MPQGWKLSCRRLNLCFSHQIASRDLVRETRRCVYLSFLPDHVSLTNLYGTDPILGSSISDVFGSLSSSTSPIAQEAILNTALPALASTMTEIQTDPLSIRASTAIDITDSIFSHLQTPLPSGAFDRVAENLFGALNATDDRDVTQSGLNIITTVIRKDVEQLLNW